MTAFRKAFLCRALNPSTLNTTSFELSNRTSQQALNYQTELVNKLWTLAPKPQHPLNYQTKLANKALNPVTYNTTSFYQTKLISPLTKTYSYTLWKILLWQQPREKSNVNTDNWFFTLSQPRRSYQGETDRYTRITFRGESTSPHLEKGFYRDTFTSVLRCFCLKNINNNTGDL